MGGSVTVNLSMVVLFVVPAGERPINRTFPTLQPLAMTGWANLNRSYTYKGTSDSDVEFR
jgi:hypothetical protein